MIETFTCARCHGTFPKGWTDEEAAAESLVEWGSIPDEEQAVICDVCYQELMAWMKRPAPEGTGR